MLKICLPPALFQKKFISENGIFFEKVDEITYNAFIEIPKDKIDLIHTELGFATAAQLSIGTCPVMLMPLEINPIDTIWLKNLPLSLSKDEICSAIFEQFSPSHLTVLNRCFCETVLVKQNGTNEAFLKLLPKWDIMYMTTIYKILGSKDILLGGLTAKISGLVSGSAPTAAANNGEVYVFIDWSNVSTSQPPDHFWVSIPKLAKFMIKGRIVNERFAIGSSFRPEEVSEWDKEGFNVRNISDGGKEEQVDSVIKDVILSITLQRPVPGIIAIATGDSNGDYRQTPFVDLFLDAITSKGWLVEVYSWPEKRSRRFDDAKASTGGKLSIYDIGAAHHKGKRPPGHKPKTASVAILRTSEKIDDNIKKAGKSGITELEKFIKEINGVVAVTLYANLSSALVTFVDATKRDAAVKLRHFFLNSHLEIGLLQDHLNFKLFVDLSHFSRIGHTLSHIYIFTEFFQSLALILLDF